MGKVKDKDIEDMMLMEEFIRFSSGEIRNQFKCSFSSQETLDIEVNSLNNRILVSTNEGSPIFLDRQNALQLIITLNELIQDLEQS